MIDDLSLPLALVTETDPDVSRRAEVVEFPPDLRTKEP